MKTALITGITGQGGSYLAELLFSKGYRVYRLTPNRNSIRVGRLQAFLLRVEMVDGELRDQSSLINALLRSKPGEVYNLADISNPTRIREELERKPSRILEDLVHMMVEADVALERGKKA